MSTTPSQERATRIAYNLLRLGVSRSGVERLMLEYPYALIEKQLAYLPFRKAKRPEAMIIQSIRNNYSAPKNFYAPPQTNAPTTKRPLDQSAECAPGQAASQAPGYGTPAPAHPPPPDDWLEPGDQDGDSPVQITDEADW